MTDRPIIFSAPMVRALLDGRKTQTRRILKPQAAAGAYRLATYDPQGLAYFACNDTGEMKRVRIPYAPGDRLYVRETVTQQETDQGVGFQTYAADGSQVWPLTQWYHKRKSIPSIHMPRWASRLTLTVTEVRVQRLQEISDADAVAEGCKGHNSPCGDHDVAPWEEFHDLWNSLHGPEAWAANPWVVAISFTVQHGNIDQIGGVA